jgi:lipopolysaccharide transport system ATP-binding protein
MSDTAIQVEKIGKLYSIGRRERYRTLRDTIADAVRAPFRKHQKKGEDLWALKHVSFEVQQGEMVGVIGRNGAGKSTLMKVLSRITEPTEGRVEIRGRIGSLLEVGTGFHPELTGRENVYLNGAILGMKRSEIDRKFDDIAAFAEVEKFLDTPVKRYSTGMHVRLAFAVAAHLDCEVMIVDEVLSVGDLKFQKKCLTKMDDVASEGRTILFVSHQLSQIRRICSKTVWLDSGQVRAVGPTGEVVSRYESSMTNGDSTRRTDPNAKAQFLGWDVMDSRERSNGHICDTLGPIRIRFVLDISRPLSRAFHGIALYRSSDRQLIWGNGSHGLDFPAGRHQIIYHMNTLPLRPGAYQWLVTLHDESGLLDYWESAPDLLVSTAPTNNALDEWSGIVNLPFTVVVEPLASEVLIVRGDNSDEALH